MAWPKDTEHKVAASGTLEGLTKLLQQHYFSPSIYIKDGKAYNSKGHIDDLKIHKSGGKYMAYFPKVQNPSRWTDLDRKLSEQTVWVMERKIKESQYGLPIDQLTQKEHIALMVFPEIFENDNGYIKLKKTGRRNPKPHPTELSISDREKIIKGLRADIQRAKEIEIYRGRGMAPVIRDINKRIKKQLDEIAKQSGKIKNHTATAQGFRNFQKDRVNEHVEMFQGKNDGKRTRLLKSDLAPKEDMSLLGKLVLMRTKRDGKNFDVHFDGNATLAMDGRKNLWVAGSDSIITDFKRAANKKVLSYIGKLYQIDYVTAKQHIENGETVRFYHKLGEVTGDCPRLYIDHDGFPIIIGGGYDVWDVGIVN